MGIVHTNRFSGFSPNQNFGGALAPPPPTPLGTVAIYLEHHNLLLTNLQYMSKEECTWGLL